MNLKCREDVHDKTRALEIQQCMIGASAEIGQGPMVLKDKVKWEEVLNGEATSASGAAGSAPPKTEEEKAEEEEQKEKDDTVDKLKKEPVKVHVLFYVVVLLRKNACPKQTPHRLCT